MASSGLCGHLHLTVHRQMSRQTHIHRNQNKKDKDNCLIWSNQLHKRQFRSQAEEGQSLWVQSQSVVHCEMLSQKQCFLHGMMVYTFNPSTLSAETGGSGVQDQLQLFNKLMASFKWHETPFQKQSSLQSKDNLVEFWIYIYINIYYSFIYI